MDILDDLKSYSSSFQKSSLYHWTEKNFWVLFLFSIIAWFGYYIRSRNR
ncbi:MAG: hypothetical protein Q8R18_04195 [bacterium]|nr:hypothetical protein [bacterium]